MPVGRTTEVREEGWGFYSLESEPLGPPSLRVARSEGSSACMMLARLDALVEGGEEEG